MDKPTAKGKPVVNVIYVSDNESVTLLPLEMLIANFDMSGGWYDRMSAEHMRGELESRGWCEGLHSDGHYLVFDPNKLGVEPSPATHDAYKRLMEASPLPLRPSVRSIMTAAGYEEHHTGGGCMAWRKTKADKTSFWICDEDNGLGDRVDEMYLTGHYDSDGDLIDEGTTENLQAALAWVDAR
jgi:hypothetical protein